MELQLKCRFQGKCYREDAHKVISKKYKFNDFLAHFLIILFPKPKPYDLPVCISESIVFLEIYQLKLSSSISIRQEVSGFPFFLFGGREKDVIQNKPVTRRIGV